MADISVANLLASVVMPACTVVERGRCWRVMYLNMSRTGKLDVSVTGIVTNVDGTDMAIAMGG